MRGLLSGSSHKTIAHRSQPTIQLLSTIYVQHVWYDASVSAAYQAQGKPSIPIQCLFRNNGLGQDTHHQIQSVRHHLGVSRRPCQIVEAILTRLID